jgi:hypothetical protein
VIVDARGASQSPDGDKAAGLDVYSEVMQRIRSTYGEPDDCRPVATDGLAVKLPRSALDNELGLTAWRRGALGRILARARLGLEVLVGLSLLRFRIRSGTTDWGDYKDHLVANTDFRKFDGSLRLVLSGTAAQRERLTAYLDGRREAGELAYGLHVARSAVMTCLIEERQGAHFHFVERGGRRLRRRGAGHEGERGARGGSRVGSGARTATPCRLCSSHSSRSFRPRARPRRPTT